MAWALLPVKAPQAAKSRLAACLSGEERGEVIGMVEIQGKAWAGRDAESKPLALGLLAMGLGAAHSEARDKGAGEGKGEAIRARAVLISGEAHIPPGGREHRKVLLTQKRHV